LTDDTLRRRLTWADWIVAVLTLAFWVAESFALNHNLTSTGVQVQGRYEHERGLARTIGSEHHPVFAPGNIPRDIVQYGVGVALQGDVA
jgi:hypothetical protein